MPDPDTLGLREDTRNMLCSRIQSWFDLASEVGKRSFGDRSVTITVLVISTSKSGNMTWSFLLLGQYRSAVPAEIWNSQPKSSLHGQVTWWCSSYHKRHTTTCIVQLGGFDSLHSSDALKTVVKLFYLTTNVLLPFPNVPDPNLTPSCCFTGIPKSVVNVIQMKRVNQQLRMMPAEAVLRYWQDQYNSDPASCKFPCTFSGLLDILKGLGHADLILDLGLHRALPVQQAVM